MSVHAAGAPSFHPRAVRLLRARVPLDREAANARAAWRERAYLYVEICDGSGARGVGEAAPLPGYSEETLEACEAALAGAPWAAFFGLLERSGQGPAGAFLTQLAQVLPGLPAAAQHAIETAALDLLAQRRGVPLWRLLSDAARAVPLNALLDADTDAAVLAQARDAAARGIGVLKLKVGRAGAFARELALLRALRAAHPGAALRLDANGVWGVDEAREKLARLAPLGIEYVEEPVPAGALQALLAQPLAVPLALDESLRTLAPDALSGCLESGGIAAVVLKPMALGGVRRCLEVAHAARGVDAVVTHLFDGAVALAVATELAAALPRVRACGLDFQPPAGCGARIPVVRGAVRAPRSQPGLGVEIHADDVREVFRS